MDEVREMESLQQKLLRVRPPRVKITYDVETGGAIEKKELPFVVAVLSDLSAKPAEPLPKLKDRKFVEVDRDNLNDVMAAAAPRVAFQVSNTLAGDGSALNVELTFRDMEAFEPVSVIKQVAPLNKLFEARQRLLDLLTSLDGNDDLDGLLDDVITSTEQQKLLKQELGAKG